MLGTPTDHEKHQEPVPRGFARRIARDLAFLGVLALIPLTIARFIATDWPFELLSHFQFQYWFASIATISLAMLARSTRLSVAALLPFLLTTLAIGPYWLGGQSGFASEPASTITIFHANVLTDNREHHLVLEVIAQHNPDIIVLQEADRNWLAGMDPLRAEYAHVLEAPRGDNFGMLVFSRLPFEEVSAESFGEFELPWFKFTIAVDDGLIDIIAIHPLPPMRSNTARERNAQLAAVAEVVGQNANPTVVVGDLNVTPWSLHFSQLIAKTGLRDARRGFGLKPTWPTNFPAFCRIPIDHCLVSDEIAVRSFELGDPIGGDHLPVIVELARERRDE